MKSFALLASIAALAGFSAAQFGDGLPACAQTCAGQYLNGDSIAGCKLGDYPCVCGNKAFIDGIACCLAKPGGCNQEDQSKAVVFAAKVCQGFGVSVPTAVVCSSTTSGPTKTGFAPKQTGMGNAAGLAGMVVAGVAML